MTALVALEKMSLDSSMRVTKNATLAPPCKINVRTGERWRFDTLLRCILLNSANDASIVIAEGTSGSVQSFANLMNRRAKDMGALHTHFSNPHGLDAPGHYTTARDMALIFQQAIRCDTFRAIAGTKTMCVKSPGSRTINLKNHNRLLGTYPGMLYGKTGYTSKAQRCFVGKASRNGHELIVCVLGSRNHFLDASRLLDHGFRMVQPDKVLTQVAVKSDPTPVPNSLRKSYPVTRTENGYVLQTASFVDSEKASDLQAALVAQGYQSFIESVLLSKGTPCHRVKVGYFADRESAERTCAQIRREFNLEPLILHQ